MKNRQLIDMKRLIFPALLIICGAATNLQAQSFMLERKFTKADLQWKVNEPGKAILAYRDILMKDTVPDQYKSLVYMRIAQARYQTGLKDSCRMTLDEMMKLPYVPAHHQLMAEELKKKIQGIPVNENTTVSYSGKVAARLVVSTTGEKTEKGEETYRTLEDALNAMVALREKGAPEGSFEIIISDALYNPGRTIHLDSRYSGTERNPVVIRSALTGHRAAMSGGVQLSSWKPEKDGKILDRLPQRSKRTVLVADLRKNGVKGIDSLVFGGFSSRRSSAGLGSRFASFPVPELFYRGEPQWMSRWPNVGDTLVPLAKFRNERVLRWAGETDMWLHGYWKYMWADAYEKVASISVKDTLIVLQPPLNNYGFGDSKWHVVNALSELDSPGEWCISVEKGKIWYFPPITFDPAECILSVTGPILEVDGCNYLTVRDIDLRYVRGDAMVFQNCSNLSVLNCTVRNASGYGMRIINGKNNLVHSCTIEGMGRGGIDILSGDKILLEESGTIIENCRINHLSRIDRTYTPAILLEGAGIKVRHCLFSDIPSSAIRLEGNDMLIEMNEFDRCVTESDDQGSIDVFGNPLYRGNIIRWNFFRDIGVPGLHMAAAVRLDDAICGFSIYENLMIRSASGVFGGVQVHGGNENYIEGNIFADCNAAISQSAWGDKRWEASLAEEGHPARKALTTTDWQGALWQKRYPALKHLREGGTDNNYSADNLLINGKSFFLRNSPKFTSFNDEILKIRQVTDQPSDYKKYVAPWQSFPLEKIGPY